MEAEDDARALCNRGGLERELDVACHLRKEQIDGLANELPRGIGGLDIAPARSSGARIELVDVETQHGMLHVVRDRLGRSVPCDSSSAIAIAVRCSHASWSVATGAARPTPGAIVLRAGSRRTGKALRSATSSNATTP
jgi:hypothetical protein